MARVVRRSLKAAKRASRLGRKLGGGVGLGRTPGRAWLTPGRRAQTMGALERAIAANRANPFNKALHPIDPRTGRFAPHGGEKPTPWGVRAVGGAGRQAVTAGPLSRQQLGRAAMGARPGGASQTGGGPVALPSGKPGVVYPSYGTSRTFKDPVSGKTVTTPGSAAWYDQGPITDPVTGQVRQRMTDEAYSSVRRALSHRLIGATEQRPDGYAQTGPDGQTALRRGVQGMADRHSGRHLNPDNPEHASRLRNGRRTGQIRTAEQQHDIEQLSTDSKFYHAVAEAQTQRHVVPGGAGLKIGTRKIQESPKDDGFTYIDGKPHYLKPGVEPTVQNGSSIDNWQEVHPDVLRAVHTLDARGEKETLPASAILNWTTSPEKAFGVSAVQNPDGTWSIPDQSARIGRPIIISDAARAGRFGDRLTYDQVASVAQGKPVVNFSVWAAPGTGVIAPGGRHDPQAGELGFIRAGTYAQVTSIDKLPDGSMQVGLVAHPIAKGLEPGRLLGHRLPARERIGRQAVATTRKTPHGAEVVVEPPLSTRPPAPGKAPGEQTRTAVRAPLRRKPVSKEIARAMEVVRKQAMEGLRGGRKPMFMDMVDYKDGKRVVRQLTGPETKYLRKTITDPKASSEVKGAIAKITGRSDFGDTSDKANVDKLIQQTRQAMARYSEPPSAARAARIKREVAAMPVPAREAAPAKFVRTVRRPATRAGKAPKAVTTPVKKRPLVAEENYVKDLQTGATGQIMAVGANGRATVKWFGRVGPGGEAEKTLPHMDLSDEKRYKLGVTRRPMKGGGYDVLHTSRQEAKAAKKLALAEEAQAASDKRAKRSADIATLQSKLKKTTREQKQLETLLRDELNDDQRLPVTSGPAPAPSATATPVKVASDRVGPFESMRAPRGGDQVLKLESSEAATAAVRRQKAIDKLHDELEFDADERNADTILRDTLSRMQGHVGSNPELRRAGAVTFADLDQQLERDYPGLADSGLVHSVIAKLAGHDPNLKLGHLSGRALTGRIDDAALDVNGRPYHYLQFKPEGLPTQTGELAKRWFGEPGDGGSWDRGIVARTGRVVSGEAGVVTVRWDDTKKDEVISWPDIKDKKQVGEFLKNYRFLSPDERKALDLAQKRESLAQVQRWGTAGPTPAHELPAAERGAEGGLRAARPVQPEEVGTRAVSLKSLPKEEQEQIRGALRGDLVGDKGFSDDLHVRQVQMANGTRKAYRAVKGNSTEEAVPVDLLRDRLKESWGGRFTDKRFDALVKRMVKADQATLSDDGRLITVHNADKYERLPVEKATGIAAEEERRQARLRAESERRRGAVHIIEGRERSVAAEMARGAEALRARSKKEAAQKAEAAVSERGLVSGEKATVRAASVLKDPARYLDMMREERMADWETHLELTGRREPYEALIQAIWPDAFKGVPVEDRRKIPAARTKERMRGAIMRHLADPEVSFEDINKEVSGTQKAGRAAAKAAGRTVRAPKPAELPAWAQAAKLTQSEFGDYQALTNAEKSAYRAARGRGDTHAAAVKWAKTPPAERVRKVTVLRQAPVKAAPTKAVPAKVTPTKAVPAKRVVKAAVPAKKAPAPVAPVKAAGRTIQAANPDAIAANVLKGDASGVTDQLRLAELRAIATRVALPGRSKLNLEQLRGALRQHAAGLKPTVPVKAAKAGKKAARKAAQMGARPATEPAQAARKIAAPVAESDTVTRAMERIGANPSPEQLDTILKSRSLLKPHKAALVRRLGGTVDQKDTVPVLNEKIRALVSAKRAGELAQAEKQLARVTPQVGKPGTSTKRAVVKATAQTRAATKTVEAEVARATTPQIDITPNQRGLLETATRLKGPFLAQDIAGDRHLGGVASSLRAMERKGLLESQIGPGGKSQFKVTDLGRRVFKAAPEAPAPTKAVKKATKAAGKTVTAPAPTPTKAVKKAVKAAAPVVKRAPTEFQQPEDALGRVAQLEAQVEKVSDPTKGYVQATQRGFIQMDAPGPAPKDHAGLMRWLGSFDTPPSRQQATAVLSKLSEAQLRRVAKELKLPDAKTIEPDRLVSDIVFAEPGRRLDSIAIRGFTGIRPGEGRVGVPELPGTAAAVKPTKAVVRRATTAPRAVAKRAVTVTPEIDELHAAILRSTTPQEARDLLRTADQKTLTALSRKVGFSLWRPATTSIVERRREAASFLVGAKLAHDAKMFRAPTVGRDRSPYTSADDFLGRAPDDVLRYVSIRIHRGPNITLPFGITDEQIAKELARRHGIRGLPPLASLTGPPSADDELDAIRTRATGTEHRPPGISSQRTALRITRAGELTGSIDAADVSRMVPNPTEDNNPVRVRDLLVAGEQDIRQGLAWHDVTPDGRSATYLIQTDGTPSGEEEARQVLQVLRRSQSKLPAYGKTVARAHVVVHGDSPRETITRQARLARGIKDDNAFPLVQAEAFHTGGLTMWYRGRRYAMSRTPSYQDYTQFHETGHHAHFGLGMHEDSQIPDSVRRAWQAPPSPRWKDWGFRPLVEDVHMREFARGLRALYGGYRSDGVIQRPATEYGRKLGLEAISDEDAFYNLGQLGWMVRGDTQVPVWYRDIYAARAAALFDRIYPDAYRHQLEEIAHARRRISTPESKVLSRADLADLILGGPEGQERVPHAIETPVPKKLTARDFRFSHGELHTVPERQFKVREGTTGFSGTIQTKDGRVVGDFHYHVTPGTGIAHLDSTALEEDFQKRGFTKAFQTAVERKLADAGIHTITLDASYGGAPAWAKLGYNWLTPDMPGRRGAGDLPYNMMDRLQKGDLSDADADLIRGWLDRFVSSPDDSSRWPSLQEIVSHPIGEKILQGEHVGPSFRAAKRIGIPGPLSRGAEPIKPAKAAKKAVRKATAATPTPAPAKAAKKAVKKAAAPAKAATPAKAAPTKAAPAATRTVQAAIPTGVAAALRHIASTKTKPVKRTADFPDEIRTQLPSNGISALVSRGLARKGVNGDYELTEKGVSVDKALRAARGAATRAAKKTTAAAPAPEAAPAKKVAIKKAAPAKVAKAAERVTPTPAAPKKVIAKKAAAPAKKVAQPPAPEPIPAPRSPVKRAVKAAAPAKKAAAPTPAPATTTRMSEWAKKAGLTDEQWADYESLKSVALPEGTKDRRANFRASLSRGISHDEALKIARGEAAAPRPTVRRAGQAVSEAPGAAAVKPVVRRGIPVATARSAQTRGMQIGDTATAQDVRDAVALHDRPKLRPEITPEPSPDFDDTRALRYRPLPGRETPATIVVEKPGHKTAITDSSGNTMHMEGTWVRVPENPDDPDGPFYGVEYGRWLDTYRRVPGTDNWEKIAPVDAYRLGPDEKPVQIITRNKGKIEKIDTAGPGDWVVRQKHGEVQKVTDEKFRGRYDMNPATVAPNGRKAVVQRVKVSNALGGDVVQKPQGAISGRIDEDKEWALPHLIGDSVTGPEGIPVKGLRLPVTVDGVQKTRNIPNGTVWRHESGALVLVEHGDSPQEISHARRLQRELTAHHIDRFGDKPFPVSYTVTGNTGVLKANGKEWTQWAEALPHGIRVYDNGKVLDRLEPHGWERESYLSETIDHELAHVAHMRGQRPTILDTKGNPTVAYAAALQEQPQIQQLVHLESLPRDRPSDEFVAAVLKRARGQTDGWNVPGASTEYGGSNVVEAAAEDEALYLKGPVAIGHFRDGSVKPVYLSDVYPERSKLFAQTHPDVAMRQREGRAGVLSPSYRPAGDVVRRLTPAMQRDRDIIRNASLDETGKGEHRWVSPTKVGITQQMAQDLALRGLLEERQDPQTGYMVRIPQASLRQSAEQKRRIQKLLDSLAEQMSPGIATRATQAHVAKEVGVSRPGQIRLGRMRRAVVSEQRRVLQGLVGDPLRFRMRGLLSPEIADDLQAWREGEHLPKPEEDRLVEALTKQLDSWGISRLFADDAQAQRILDRVRDRGSHRFDKFYRLRERKALAELPPDQFSRAREIELEKRVGRAKFDLTEARKGNDQTKIRHAQENLDAAERDLDQVSSVRNMFSEALQRKMDAAEAPEPLTAAEEKYLREMTPTVEAWEQREARRLSAVANRDRWERLGFRPVSPAHHERARRALQQVIDSERHTQQLPARGTLSSKQIRGLESELAQASADMEKARIDNDPKAMTLAWKRYLDAQGALDKDLGTEPVRVPSNALSDLSDFRRMVDLQDMPPAAQVRSLHRKQESILEEMQEAKKKGNVRKYIDAKRRFDGYEELSAAIEKSQLPGTSDADVQRDIADDIEIHTKGLKQLDTVSEGLDRLASERLGRLDRDLKVNDTVYLGPKIGYGRVMTITRGKAGKPDQLSVRLDRDGTLSRVPVTDLVRVRDGHVDTDRVLLRKTLPNDGSAQFPYWAAVASMLDDEAQKRDDILKGFFKEDIKEVQAAAHEGELSGVDEKLHRLVGPGAPRKVSQVVEDLSPEEAAQAAERRAKEAADREAALERIRQQIPLHRETSEIPFKGAPRFTGRGQASLARKINDEIVADKPFDEKRTAIRALLDAVPEEDRAAEYRNALSALDVPEPPRRTGVDGLRNSLLINALTPAAFFSRSEKDYKALRAARRAGVQRIVRAARPISTPEVPATPPRAVKRAAAETAPVATKLVQPWRGNTLVGRQRLDVLSALYHEDGMDISRLGTLPRKVTNSVARDLATDKYMLNGEQLVERRGNNLHLTATGRRLVEDLGGPDPDVVKALQAAPTPAPAKRTGRVVKAAVPKATEAPTPAPATTAKKVVKKAVAATPAAKPAAPAVKVTRAEPELSVAKKLETATPEEGKALLDDIKRRQPLQDLAKELGVDVGPRDTMPVMREAILRHTVTRRLEHEAYLRRAQLVTAPKPTGKKVAVKRKVAKKAAPAKATAADLTGAHGLSADPGIRAVQIVNRIKVARNEIHAANDPTYPVWISDLRARVGNDVSDAEFADALRRMERGGSAALSPAHYGSELTPARRDAAVTYGGREHHRVAIGDFTSPDAMPKPARLQPLPSRPPAKKAAPVKKAPAPTTKAVTPVLPTPTPETKPAKAVVKRAGTVAAPEGETPSARLERLARAGGRMRRISDTKGGTADVTVFQAPDGSQVVRKVVSRSPVRGKEQTPAEVRREVRALTLQERLSLRLGSEMGAPVPNAIQKGTDTLWMDYVPGSVPKKGSPHLRVLEEGLDSPDARSLHLWHVLTGNIDVRPANLKITTDDKRIRSIDAGYTLSTTNSGFAFPDARDPFNNHFGTVVIKDGLPELADKVTFTTKELQDARAALKRVRPEFEDADRKVFADLIDSRIDELMERAADAKPIKATKATGRTIRAAKPITEATPEAPAAERVAPSPVRRIFTDATGARGRQASAADLAELDSVLKTASGKQLVREELERVSTEPDAVKNIDRLVTSGVMDKIFPEVSHLKSLRDEVGRQHKDVYQHTLQVVRNAIGLEEPGKPDFILRLAALLHDVGKPETRDIVQGRVAFHRHDIAGARLVRNRLRALGYGEDTIAPVSELVRLHLRAWGSGNEGEGAWTDSARRSLITDAGEHLPRLLKLFRADVTSKSPVARATRQENFDKLERDLAAVKETDRIRSIKPDLSFDEVSKVLGVPGPEPGKPGHPRAQAAWDHLKQLKIENGGQPLDNPRAELQKWAKANPVEKPARPAVKRAVAKATKAAPAKAPAKVSSPVKPAGVKEDVPLVEYNRDDNMRLHTDSLTMGLVRDYAKVGRNGSANRMLELRRKATSRNPADGLTPQQVVDELRAIRAEEADPLFQRKLDRAIEGIDAPMTELPVLPVDTPPLARKLIEDLHAIPYARKGDREPTGSGRISGQSLVDQLQDVYVAISEGHRPEGKRPQEAIRSILRDKVHEINEASFRIWDLERALDTKDGKPSPLVAELRDWERRHLSGPGAPAPRGAGEEAKPARTRKAPVPHLPDEETPGVPRVPPRKVTVPKAPETEQERLDALGAALTEAFKSSRAATGRTKQVREHLETEAAKKVRREKVPGGLRRKEKTGFRTTDEWIEDLQGRGYTVQRVREGDDSEWVAVSGGGAQIGFIHRANTDSPIWIGDPNAAPDRVPPVSNRPNTDNWLRTLRAQHYSVEPIDRDNHRWEVRDKRGEFVGLIKSDEKDHPEWDPAEVDSQHDRQILRLLPRYDRYERRKDLTSPTPPLFEEGRGSDRIGEAAEGHRAPETHPPTPETREVPEGGTRHLKKSPPPKGRTRKRESDDRSKYRGGVGTPGRLLGVPNNGPDNFPGGGFFPNFPNLGGGQGATGGRASKAATRALKKIKAPGAPDIPAENLLGNEPTVPIAEPSIPTSAVQGRLYPRPTSPLVPGLGTVLPELSPQSRPTVRRAPVTAPVLIGRAGIRGQRVGQPLTPKLESLLDDLSYGDVPSMVGQISSKATTADAVNALARRAGVGDELANVRGREGRIRRLAKALNQKFGQTPVESAPSDTGTGVSGTMPSAGSTVAPKLASTPEGKQLAKLEDQLQRAREQAARLTGHSGRSGVGAAAVDEAADHVAQLEDQVSALRARINPNPAAWNRADRLRALQDAGTSLADAQRAVGLTPEESGIANGGLLPAAAVGRPIRVRRPAVAPPGEQQPQIFELPPAGTAEPRMIEMVRRPPGAIEGKPTKPLSDEALGGMAPDEIMGAYRSGRARVGNAGHALRKKAAEQEAAASHASEPDKALFKAEAARINGMANAIESGAVAGGLDSMGVPAGGGGGNGVTFLSAESIRETLSKLTSAAAATTYLENLQITPAGLHTLAEALGVEVPKNATDEEIIAAIAETVE